MGSEIRSANLWIALNPCGGRHESPGIDLIPKRVDKIVRTGTHQANFDWTVGKQEVVNEFPDTPPITPEFNPGDAVFFDHLNLHRTSWLPEMKHNRYAIECWFFASSKYPEEQIPMIF